MGVYFAQLCKIMLCSRVGRSQFQGWITEGSRKTNHKETQNKDKDVSRETLNSHSNTQNHFQSRSCGGGQRGLISVCKKYGPFGVTLIHPCIILPTLYPVVLLVPISTHTHTWRRQRMMQSTVSSKSLLL